MEHEIVEDNGNLERCISQVGNIFDLSKILNESQATSQISHFYLINRLALHFYNPGGFFHYGISYDGKYKEVDLNEPARIIEGYIREREAEKVMELASGLGPNIAFLARRNPDVAFTGVDLFNKPLRRHKKSSNAHFYCGDFHDLSQFEDNSYDIIFVVESLLYSTNKSIVFREVWKKLRKGGLFIVIDLYQRDRAESLSVSEELLWRLIAKSIACETIERVSVVEDYMQQKFSVTVSKDITQWVMPSVVRREHLARFYFSHPGLARAVNTFVPHDFAKNTIHTLFLPISVRRQTGCWYLHVLKKDT